MFFVYVLRSEVTGRRYVGSCQDLERRLAQHNARQSKATRPGFPWVLVHAERFAKREEAVCRERFLKTGRGRDELDRIESTGQPTR